ncbi:MAG: ABC transporter substrate-binding protein [Oscillospiraceae bacterium]|jgi:ABC-type nitrate/sulfonate/bicarbonate transport system substrate-binding protein|nr:ABC transporter substrate-binding protein [Oscillospiraceae bacterium]
MKQVKKGSSFLKVLALVLALTFALAACSKSGDGTSPTPVGSPGTGEPGTPAGNEPGTPAELITLKTTTKKDCSSTPWVLGEVLGIFEKHGIQIEYTGEIASGGDALAAILNGTNDIGGGFPNSIATYIAAGSPIKGVVLNQVDPPAGSDVDPKYRHMRFYVSKSSGITSLADLANYTGPITISGRAPSCSSFIPSQIFKNNGLDASRLEFVPMDSDTASLQAVQRGDLVIAGIHPPFYYLADGESDLVLLADSADTGLGAASGTTLFYFTEEFIANNPDTVQRFVDAIKEAQLYALEHPDEAIALTGAYIEKEINAVHYFYTGEDPFPVELFQPWIDDLVDNGALTPGQIKPEDLFTLQFVGSNG